MHDIQRIQLSNFTYSRLNILSINVLLLSDIFNFIYSNYIFFKNWDFSFPFLNNLFL